eukprot:scaffold76408_cov33-Phaeocystis_antarctica.AAC.1
MGHGAWGMGYRALGSPAARCALTSRAGWRARRGCACAALSRARRALPDRPHSGRRRPRGRSRSRGRRGSAAPAANGAASPARQRSRTCKPIQRTRPVWPTSQNISANRPRLAEAGGRPELDLALAWRAGSELAEASRGLLST